MKYIDKNGQKSTEGRGKSEINTEERDKGEIEVIGTWEGGEYMNGSKEP